MEAFIAWTEAAKLKAFEGALVASAALGSKAEVLKGSEAAGVGSPGKGLGLRVSALGSISSGSGFKVRALRKFVKARGRASVA